MQSGRFYNEFKSRANPNPQVADDVNDVNLDGFRNMDYEAFGINPQDLAQQTPNFKFNSVDDTTSRIFDNQNIVPNQGLNQPPKPQSGVDIIEQLANLNRSMKGQPPLRPQEPNINPQQQSSLDSINRVNDELAKEAEVFTKRGFVNQNMASNIAGMTAGGGIGATLDRENPTRGFIAGAISGAVGANALPKLANGGMDLINGMLGKNTQNNILKSEVLKKDLTNSGTISKFDKGVNELRKVNYDDLTEQQKGVYDVFMGHRNQTDIRISDLNDVLSLERGSRTLGARKIMIKHAGIDKTGGLSSDELINIENIAKYGELKPESFEMRENSLRYAYEAKAGDNTLYLVVDEFNDGKKVFDFYSDRNFTDYKVATNNKQQPIPNVASAETIPPNHLNSTKMKGGYTTQVMTHNILAASLGAGLGSAYAPEDKRLAGAVAGAFGVMGLANVSSVFNAVRNIVRDTGIDNAIKAGVDKTIVKTANKFLSDEANKIWGDVTGGMLNELKLKFSNTLDESYEVARDKVTGTMSSYYNKMVDLSAVLSKISKEDNKALYDFFVNGAKIDTLKPELREFANNAREQIIKEFSYQVDSGLISKEVADEFGGNFLSRVYENEKLAHKFKEYFFGSNSFTVDKMYARGTTKTVDEATYNSLLKGDLFEGSKIATKGDKGFSQEGKWILEGQKYNSLGKKEYILRRDYTSAEREAMGEVTDVAKLLPQTLYKMTERRVNNEFLTQIFLYHQSAFLLIIF
ncbi:hypothetical protein [Campylobacter geochelonis]|uniref:hypothetical protein n=1 Tax=Campylobacter geochelonis TaxID=1780362 RepID=UPI000770A6E3|nr:hypothetical protein [Campylobacter geochelonis]CZE49809.1 Uncharacterised protein [Campylobacter geochelonis]